MVLWFIKIYIASLERPLNYKHSGECSGFTIRWSEM